MSRPAETAFLPAALEIEEMPPSPAGRATLALRAVVDPPSEQLVWYVDGAPFQVADHPYTSRWPLSPGKHTFQARLPYQDVRSRTIHVTVY